MKKLLVAFALVLGLSSVARADITIPVSSGSTPTCVGRLYSEILVPLHWGSDNTVATTFAQSPEGVLGITMFFEIGPYGEFDAYDYNGKNAMWGVGVVSYNRFINNDKIENVNNHQEVARGGLIAVIKESQAWHHEDYQGTGTLLEGQRNRFYSILNGSPNTLDCGGLLGSWRLAISFIQQTSGTGHPAANPYVIQTSPAPRGLFYASSTSVSSSTLPGVSTTKLQYAQSVGSWIVPKYPSGSYSENFFTLTDAQPVSGSYYK